MTVVKRRQILFFGGIFLVLCVLGFVFLPGYLENRTYIARPLIKVLFVGDSYTSKNNLPDLVENLARNDPNGVYRIIADTIVLDGFNLEQLWADVEVQKKITSDKWDFIVLQPQGDWSQSRDNLFSTYRALKNWTGFAKKSGTKTMLFQTWPRQRGSHWYTEVTTKIIFGSPDRMFQKIQFGSSVMVKEHDMILVPVGTYWTRMLKENPDIPLYIADGSNPSPQGSYLAALLFYKGIAGGDISNIKYAPFSVSKEQQAQILSTVLK